MFLCTLDLVWKRDILNIFLLIALVNHRFATEMNMLKLSMDNLPSIVNITKAFTVYNINRDTHVCTEPREIDLYNIQSRHKPINWFIFRQQVS